MINDKLSRIMVLIIILAYIAHAITRIIFGKIWVADIFMLIANILWISVFLSLHFYVKGQEDTSKVTNIFLLMSLIQIVTVLLISVTDEISTDVLLNIKGVIACVLSVLQILISIYLGIILMRYKDIPIKKLGLVFLIQGLVLWVMLFLGKAIEVRLLQTKNILMMSNFMSVIFDMVEIFVAYYVYKVFMERFDDDL
jgi:hypothetical protein